MSNSVSFSGAYPRKEQPVNKLEVRISARKAAFLLTSLSDELSAKQEAELLSILKHCPMAASIHSLVREFVTMIRKQEQGFDDWLQKTTSCMVAAMENFAKGIKRNYEAVKSALDYSYSNGPVEGQVNRLKLIKRK